MKNITLVFILISFTFLSCKKDLNNLKIGILYPQTGDASFWGENATNGALLAIDDFKGKNHLKRSNIIPILFDSKSAPKEAINGINKLISQDKISFLVGDLVSSNLNAIMPIVNKSHVVTVGQGSSPLITQPNDYVFRTFPSDDLQGLVLADYLLNYKNNDRISILYINNDYGNGIKQVIQNMMGNNVGMVEGYDSKTRDFRNLILKMKSQNNIVVVGYPEEVPILLKQLKEYNYSGTIIGTETFSNDKIVNNNYKYKVLYSCPQMADSLNLTSKTFKKNFFDKYNKEPAMPADMAYDAMMIILQAVDSLGNNPELVQKSLSQLKNFSGASGKITFDKNGDVVKPFTINEIVGKKSSIIWNWLKN